MDGINATIVESVTPTMNTTGFIHTFTSLWAAVKVIDN